MSLPHASHSPTQSLSSGIFPQQQPQPNPQPPVMSEANPQPTSSSSQPASQASQPQAPQFSNPQSQSQTSGTTVSSKMMTSTTAVASNISQTSSAANFTPAPSVPLTAAGPAAPSMLSTALSSQPPASQAASHGETPNQNALLKQLLSVDNLHACDDLEPVDECIDVGRKLCLKQFQELLNLQTVEQ